jgi:hypothetical protein
MAVWTEFFIGCHAGSTDLEKAHDSLLSHGLQEPLSEWPSVDQRRALTHGAALWLELSPTASMPGLLLRGGAKAIPVLDGKKIAHRKTGYRPEKPVSMFVRKFSQRGVTRCTFHV